MTAFTEPAVEEAALISLEAIGWRIAHGSQIAPDIPAAEHADHRDVVLERRPNEGLPMSADKVSTAASYAGELIVYEAPDGEVRVDVRLERETVWLSLTQMAELLGRDKSVISRYLRKIFASGELERPATVAEDATVQRDGGRDVIRKIEFLNLDAILSVGYRVNSKRGTQFRIWAMRTLREHLLRGYTLSERRLAGARLQRDRASGRVAPPAR